MDILLASDLEILEAWQVYGGMKKWHSCAETIQGKVKGCRYCEREAIISIP